MSDAMTHFQHLSKKVAEAYNQFEEDIIRALRRHASSAIDNEIITAVDDATTTTETLAALTEKWGAEACDASCDHLIQLLERWIATGKIA